MTEYKKQYSYEEVVEKIENSRRFGKLPGVEVTRRMLAVLQEPQKGLPYIHVAGTNGKGSTCAFLSQIMKEAGLKVGCFTSPHLVDFRERICVNGKMIEKEEVTRIGNELLALEPDVTPTMFDYCLVMAVIYFQEQHCDVAVFETGLGGRLDSTNALGKPDVAVITRIGYDHMAILGNTLTEIASEKAGILKPDVPAVIAPQEEEALQVLKRYDAYFVTEQDVRDVEKMKPGLPGAYQLENAATAKKAAEIFLARHVKTQGRQEVIGQAVEAGIQNAVWKGRMEILQESPFLMVDGAHNSNGIHALKTSLMQMFPEEKFHFIMGVMADKDYEKMVEELLPLALDFATVTPESSRALQAEGLAEKIKNRGIPARSLQNVSQVFEVLTPKEKTVALGSLYFIGELEALQEDQ